MKPIIEVKNISKQFKIRHTQAKYVALRDVLTNFLKRPFSTLTNKSEEFFALKNVSFDVYKGEVVGIIGHNGAGKSTLLKILSQITPPSEGEIILHGKVGSLLEVGTGFHPELTGRENIFLNGAILGMSKEKITKNFDAIVEFAGIERFLDTPVKYYSSGMYVRLAFSVAAHMDPDILLVDEVLAVGDAEFQKKCLGKMEEVTKKDGRTILFVSHNMSAVQNLCKRSILLDGGKVVAIGDTRDIIDQYLSKQVQQETIDYSKNPFIRDIRLKDAAGSSRVEFPISEDFTLEVSFECKKEITNSTLSLHIYSPDRDLLLYSSESDSKGVLMTYAPGMYTKKITIPAFLLNPGRYTLTVLLHEPNIKTHDRVDNISFEIKNVDNPRSVVFQGSHMGRIATILKYTDGAHS